ncbi:MAG TPA: TPM domain-containing protein [Verrucomicrobiae bacterium]|nr:TPM domain-containing protein [Verrucomicrobiae bacterium]
MKTKEFLGQIDDAKVLAAIEAAELKSSGEVRVFVSNELIEDVMATAQAQFDKIGMAKTKNRNGVLLFFAPKTQRFAVIGDQGIHEKCGQLFWDDVRGLMTERLKAGQYTDAVVAAVNRIGELLAQHFPRDPGDINELPNQIARE